MTKAPSAWISLVVLMRKEDDKSEADSSPCCRILLHICFDEWFLFAGNDIDKCRWTHFVHDGLVAQFLVRLLSRSHSCDAQVLLTRVRYSQRQALCWWRSTVARYILTKIVLCWHSALFGDLRAHTAAPMTNHA